MSSLVDALSASLIGLSAASAGLYYLTPQRQLEWRELLVPDEFPAGPVAGLLRHIAATRQGPVCIQVRAQEAQLQFFVAAPRAGIAALGMAASGLVPEARLEAVESPQSDLPSSHRATAASVAWNGPWPVLRDKTPEISVAGLLGVLAGIGAQVSVVVQLRLWPSGRVHRPVAASARSQRQANPVFMRLWWPSEPPREDLQLIRTKFSGLLLDTEIAVFAAAPARASADDAVHQVIASLRAASGPRGVVKYRLSRDAAAVRVLQRRRPPLPWQLRTLLSPEELVGISGLPIDTPAVSGVSYGAGPRLMPPQSLPQRGRVFALSNWPTTTGRPVAQPVSGGLQHAAIVGPTGSGKSTCVASLVHADMVAGRGAFVLDLKGDLVDDLLGLVPADRVDDVIVLEPARSGAQPGLQLFPPGGDPDLTADLVLGTLRQLFSDSWGIRSSQYLGLGLRTLAGVSRATLVDLPLLFADAGFRTQALSKVTDPWVRAAWQRYQALSAAERAIHVSSPLTKLEELVGRSRLRLVLGQTKPRLDFETVLAQRQIVLVSLPPGLLGAPATQLLGALTLWQFFQAVERRASVPRSARSPFFMYADEIAVLNRLPLPLDAVLERARGHGVGLALSPQSLGQLEPQLRKALLANVGSLVAFRQRSTEEAKALAEALTGVTASQLQHLGAYEVALRLSLSPGSTTPTMTGRTLPPIEPISDPVVVRQAAAARWGRTLVEVDRSLTDRVRAAAAPGADEPELGVKRRSP